MPYSVYILRTNKSTLYTGITNNLGKRIEDHKTGKGAKYMRMFESFDLIYLERELSLSEALKREAVIKKMSKAQKEELIKQKALVYNIHYEE